MSFEFAYLPDSSLPTVSAPIPAPPRGPVPNELREEVLAELETLLLETDADTGWAIASARIARLLEELGEPRIADALRVHLAS